VAATDLISLGIGGSTAAPIAYFTTFGLGDYGGTPPTPPPADETRDGGWGRESKALRRIAKRIERERDQQQALRRQIEQAFSPEVAERIEEAVEQAVEQAYDDDRPTLSPPAGVSAAEAEQALILIAQLVNLQLSLEALESRMRFVQDEEDAMVALLLI
jgi:hypothetical protein